MEFRPCIDIHNGRVKQIVGSSLRDKDNKAVENYVSEQDAAFYARYYQKHGISGGHIILLNKEGSEYFTKTREQAMAALSAYPNGMQIGGGITAENAVQYLEAGASHVIVTSYVFHNGMVDEVRLERMVKTVGKEHLVLDLSCRQKEDGYYIVTDRWQKDTQVKLTEQVLDRFAACCDEFLIHAVDVEGKAEGIEQKLAAMLGAWNGKTITYAGGVHSMEDIRCLKKLGKNRIHVTIGSALDLFGGPMRLDEVLDCMQNG